MDPIFYSLFGLRWQDALDILLNSYILFRLYVLFRGTNVFRVLLAVCVLWIFNQIALSLGLVVTNWAMQGVITIATFIIIIIFRNEISNVIQSNTLRSFFWGIPRYQSGTPVATLAKSAFDLASQKIGALIVLPMHQGIQSMIQGGIPIDGRLSRETLISLFWKDNPLHDGAAVIQGGRIVSAGVILPLTRRTDLPSYFGTRHRAALGLTQQTDALVIVVSEERGRVSLCMGGDIQAVESRQGLEQDLKDLMGEGGADRKQVGRQGVELAAAALICLLSVTGIWLSFSKGLESLATHEVPIEFLNPEPKKEILATSAEKVKVMISGSRSLVNAVKPEQIAVSLDLSRAEVGENLLHMTNKNISLPPGVTLKNIDPQDVNVSLDTLLEKEVAVQPHWIGKLPKDLVMTQAEAVPRTVKVIGGGRVLQEVATVFTEPLPLNGISQSGTVTASLVLNPASLEVANIGKIQIRYFIEKKATAQPKIAPAP